MEEKTEKKHTGKKIALLICVSAIIVILVALVLRGKIEKQNKDMMKEIFETVELVEADLTEYIVYGTHLNIKGQITDQLSNVKGVNLVLAGLSGNKQTIKLNYEKTSNGISFYTSELINEGIDLETLGIDKHFMLIEVICINRERKQRQRRK